MPAVGIGAVGAEAGNIKAETVPPHHHDTEGLADRHCGAGKKLFDLIWTRGSGDIDILDLASQQRVAHATAREQRLMARPAQGCGNPARGLHDGPVVWMEKRIHKTDQGLGFDRCGHSPTSKPTTAPPSST